MIGKLWRLGVEMLPTWELALKASIRAAMGFIAWSVGFEFVGKFCWMLAAITVVGHAEGVFVDRVAGAAKSAWLGLVALAELSTRPWPHVSRDR